MRLFISLLLFTGCKDNQLNKEEETINTESPDKLEEYLTEYIPPSRDTVRQTHKIQIDSNQFILEIAYYCQNDSMLQNQSVASYGTTVTYITSVSHNYAVNISLKTGLGEEISSSLVEKHLFNKCIDDSNISKMYIYKVDFVKNSNEALIFEAGIGVPDTDYAYFATFEISLKDQNLGEMECISSFPLEYGD